MSFLRTLLILGRVSNLPTVWTNVAAGWFLSGGGWNGELAWITLGVSLLYIGGMTTNDAFDARWDAEHAPDRPVPSGQISHRLVWLIGGIQLLAGGGLLIASTTFHPVLLLGLLFSILLYNAIHKHWKGAVLIMGLCRAFVYLGAGSAVVVQTTSIEVPGILYVVSAAVLLYIAGITLAARNEHLAVPAGTGYVNRLLLMLPVLFPLFGGRTVPTTPVSTALVIVGVFGTWAWLVIARKALSEKIPRGIAFLIAGIAFFDAAIVVFADWRAGCLCLLCFVTTLGLQRIIPAT